MGKTGAEMRLEIRGYALGSKKTNRLKWRERICLKFGGKFKCWAQDDLFVSLLQVQDMSASAAKALALEILSQWPLFGSSFFAVRELAVLLSPPD
jgi:hypothetical protein